MDFDLLQRLAVATGIGLLVGVERGWRQREERAGARTAGIRTYALIGLLGGVLGAIAKALGDALGAGIVLGVGLLVFSAAFTLFRYRETQKEKSFGITTLVAAVTLFALGAYAVLGDYRVAAALGVAVVIILAAREALHGWLTRVTWHELRAGIVLAAMSFLALPLIPDESYGPFGGINPRQIWLLAVVLAAVSFLGYAAAKGFGAKQGLLAASAAGGLVSSTAVTLTAARRAAAEEADFGLLAASAALASAVSFARTLVLIGVLNRDVALLVAVPLAAAILGALGVTYLLARRNLATRSGTGFKLRNPFLLRETLGMALLLAGALFAARSAGAWFGSSGAVVAAVIVGAADADSATYTISELVRGTLAATWGALALLLAVSANNLLKFIAGAALGGRSFALPLGFALGLPLLAAWLAALAVAAAVGGI